MNDDDDLLAAEFALGLLDDDAAAAAQERARTDAVLSLRIAWWRDQFAPLVREAAADPGADLWPRIAARLPANDDSGSLVRRWRAAALAAMSVAAALLVFVGVRPAPLPVVVTRTGPAPMVAMLGGEGGAQVAISYDGTTGRMKIMPAVLDAKSGDAELWVIPEGGKPRSMGVIDAKTPEGRAVAPDLRPLMREGATFAVSLEPKGGSPTGAPTGAVVATGKILRV